jgi:hypothetical protein
MFTNIAPRASFDGLQLHRWEAAEDLKQQCTCPRWDEPTSGEMGRRFLDAAERRR